MKRRSDRLPPWRAALVAACLGCGQEAPPVDSMARPLDGPVASLPLPFTAAATVAWVDEATLAVLDTDDGRIVLMGVDGATLASGGRKGEGPGELQTPVQVLVDEGGILVADVKQLRITEFDRELRYRRSVPVPGMPLGMVRREDHEVVLAWVGWGAGESPVIGSISLDSGEPTPGVAVFDQAPELAHVRGSGGPSPFIAVAPFAGDEVVAGHGDEYLLVRFDDAGHVAGDFGRPELPPEYPSESDIQRVRDGLRQLAGVVDEAVVQQMAERPKPHFMATSLAGAGDGGVLVVAARGTRDSTYIDRFDSSGRFLGTWVIADRVAAVAVRGRRIAALVTRASPPREGLHAVDIYDFEPASTVVAARAAGPP